MLDAVCTTTMHAATTGVSTLSPSSTTMSQYTSSNAIAPDAEWPSGSTYAPTEHANAAAATKQPIAVGDAPGVTRAAPITTSVAAPTDAGRNRARRVPGEPTRA